MGKNPRMHRHLTNKLRTKLQFFLRCILDWKKRILVWALLYRHARREFSNWCENIRSNKFHLPSALLSCGCFCVHVAFVFFFCFSTVGDKVSVKHPSVCHSFLPWKVYCPSRIPSCPNTWTELSGHPCPFVPPQKEDICQHPAWKLFASPEIYMCRYTAWQQQKKWNQIQIHVCRQQDFSVHPEFFADFGPTQSFSCFVTALTTNCGPFVGCFRIWVNVLMSCTYRCTK